MTAIASVTPTVEFYNDHTTAWADISAYTHSFTIKWGRRSGFEDMRARTCTLVVDNADRRFEPGYTSGAYSDGEIRQGSLLNVKVTVNSTEFPLFYGTVESVDIRPLTPTGTVATATIVASDLLTLLAQDRLYVVSMLADYADNMVLQALGQLSWTGGAVAVTDVTAASLVLQGFDCSGESILEVIQKVARSEGYMFYVRPYDRRADCYLTDPWGAFAASDTLVEADLTDVWLSCDADQIATVVRAICQIHNIGDAVYDKTGGTYESMWTLATHGLTTAQEVWFTAAGGGAEPFETDTHYFAIVKSANIFQLATTAINAAAGTAITGTGTDSTGAWTVCVAGSQQVVQHPADTAAYGEWPIEYSGLLLPTDADTITFARRDLDRRQKLFRLLRPVQMSTLITVGDTWEPARMALTQPFYPLTLTLDLVGAARAYNLRVQGGTVSMKPGAPLQVTAYTESADQWET